MEPDELVNLVECLATQIEARRVDSSRPGFEHANDIDAAALSSFLASAPRHIDDPKVHMQFHGPCCLDMIASGQQSPLHAWTCPCRAIPPL